MIQSDSTAPFEEPLDFKGDRLGMPLANFKRKYDRAIANHDKRAPFCSDCQPGRAIDTLLSESYFSEAGLVNCRTTFPFEETTFRNNQSTIAGIPTELVIYHFVDEQLYKVTVWFPRAGFGSVCEAYHAKYGSPSEHRTEGLRNALGVEFEGLVVGWKNGASAIILREIFGDLDRSSLVLVHFELNRIAASRVPGPAVDDI